MGWDTHYLSDVNCLVRCKEYAADMPQLGMTFEAFEVAGCGEWDWQVERRGAKECCDWVPVWDLDQGQTIVRGTITWEGAAHLYFGESDERSPGYIYLYGAPDAKKFAQLLEHLFRMAYCLYIQANSKGAQEGDFQFDGDEE